MRRGCEWQGESSSAFIAFCSVSIMDGSTRISAKRHTKNELTMINKWQHCIYIFKVLNNFSLKYIWHTILVSSVEHSDSTITIQNAQHSIVTVCHHSKLLQYYWLTFITGSSTSLSPLPISPIMFLPFPVATISLFSLSLLLVFFVAAVHLFLKFHVEVKSYGTCLSLIYFT